MPSANPSSEQRFKVKAEIRYTVDVGVFTASSEEEAKKLAVVSQRYTHVVDRNRAGVYDLEARPVQEGHNSKCGCGWCK